MKTRRLLLALLFAALFLIVSLGSHVVSAQTTTQYGMRLPFIGSYKISTAPGCYYTHTSPQNREAVDFSMPRGTPIYAAYPGYIIEENDFLGLTVATESEGIKVYYGHFSWVYPREIGSRVERGDLLGLSGKTGNSTGPHLHEEWRDENNLAFEFIDHVDGVVWDSPTEPETCNTGSDNYYGTATGGPLDHTYWDNCEEFYALGRYGLWGFDSPNCQGNILFSNLGPGTYNYADTMSDNRLRSVSVSPGLHFWLYAYGDNDSLLHCHENDMWNLDTDYYNIVTGQRDTRIGFDPGVGDNVYNMVSKVVVTTEDCPSQSTRASASLEYNGTGVGGSDNIPPETYISYEEPDGKNGWYVNTVDISLSAFDDAGVYVTYHTLNGSSPMEGNTFSLVDDGVYNVCYWSVDNVGNIESPKCVEIKLDQTPPEISGTLTGPRDINGIFRDAVSANLNPIDNLSGVANVQCSPDSGSSWTTLDPWSFTIEGQGVHQYTCKAEDMAGNVSEDLDSGPVIINTYAIFSSDPNDGLVIDRGTRDRITGDLYSEGAVLVDDNTGSIFNGSLHISNGGYDFTSGNTNVTDNLDVFYNVDHVNGISYPFSYYWQRCDQVYDDDLEIDSVNVYISGVICIDGDLDVTATTVNGDVTFVVNGDIEFNPTRGAYRTTDPDNGLVMYATGNIALLGTDYLVVGHVYAPNGDIIVRSTDLTIRGSLVALHVEFYKSTDVILEYEPAFEAQTFDMPLANDGFADPDNGDTGGSGGGTVPATATPAPTATATPLPTQTPIPSPTPLPTSTPLVTPTPVVEIPCDTCDYHYTGYLNDGGSVVVPSTYFTVDSYGYLDGWLSGDNPDANFDLYLYRWTGSTWQYAGSRTSSDSNEHLRRFASPGYYVWRVVSDIGFGNYDLWVDVP